MDDLQLTRHMSENIIEYDEIESQARKNETKNEWTT